jgi:hypothetical protein
MSKLADKLLAKAAAKTGKTTVPTVTGTFSGLSRPRSDSSYFPSFEEVESFPQTECLRETDAAILCRIRSWGEQEEIWIPKSQVDDSSEVKGLLDFGELVVSRWIAEQKELV